MMFLVTKQPNQYCPHFEEMEFFFGGVFFTIFFDGVIIFLFSCVQSTTQKQSFPEKVTKTFHCHYLPHNPLLVHIIQP